MADSLDARWDRLRRRLEQAGAPPEDERAAAADLARAVTGESDTALTCDECEARLPSYVEAEIGGRPLDDALLAVRRHLALCRACETLYLELLDIELAAEAGAIPQSPPPLLARLDFLPPLSLEEYVKAMVARVVTAAAPGLLADLDMLSSGFYARMRQLGGQFVPAQEYSQRLAYGSGGPWPEALKYLAATYATTQTLIRAFSRSDIEQQAQSGAWDEIVWLEAQRTARALTLNQKQARAFADQYAAATRDDVAGLAALADAHQ